jgi:multisubunit Na+/H+ antiporter MnhF subunit
MAKVTIVFGVALIALGLVGFLGTGSVHYTALIPAWIGLLLSGLGIMANTPDAKRRGIYMHVAVTLGLLGFLATFKGGVIDYILMVRGKWFKYPASVESKAAMSLLMLVFVLLCVRSFISARRDRI